MTTNPFLSSSPPPCPWRHQSLKTRDSPPLPTVCGGKRTLAAHGPKSVLQLVPSDEAKGVEQGAQRPIGGQLHRHLQAGHRGEVMRPWNKGPRDP